MTQTTPSMDSTVVLREAEPADAEAGGQIVFDAFASIHDHHRFALVPLRSGLLRWCLENGLRSIKPMNVMARGAYQEPDGSWFPSVLY